MTHTTNGAVARSFGQELYFSLRQLWSNPVFRIGVVFSVVAAMLLLSNDTMAAEKVGLSRWQEDTLQPQAKSAWFIIKIVAIVLGLIFMVVGFVKLTGQQKSGAWPMILVGGLLASVTTFVVLTGETVSGSKLDNDANSVLGLGGGATGDTVD